MVLRNARGFSVTLSLLVLLFSLPHPSFQGRIKGRWNKGGKSCILKAPPLGWCSRVVMFVLPPVSKLKCLHCCTTRLRRQHASAVLGNTFACCVIWGISYHSVSDAESWPLLFLHPVSSAPVMSCPECRHNFSLFLSLSSKRKVERVTNLSLFKRSKVMLKKRCVHRRSRVSLLWF